MNANTIQQWINNSGLDTAAAKALSTVLLDMQADIDANEAAITAQGVAEEAQTISASFVQQYEGAALTIRSETVLLDELDGATATATDLIPAGAIVFGVTVHVTEAIVGGPDDFSIGDGTDTDRWGTGILVAAATVTTGLDFTITSVPIYTAATSVVITANTTPFDVAEDGAISVTVHYAILG